jgi:hypothetical protein
MNAPNEVERTERMRVTEKNRFRCGIRGATVIDKYGSEEV